MDRRSFLKKSGLAALALALFPKNLFADTPEVEEDPEQVIETWETTTETEDFGGENITSTNHGEIVFAKKNDILLDTFLVPMDGYYQVCEQVDLMGYTKKNSFSVWRIK